jgi:BirA family biotin operon repressor/biotin-[acetyl-CoA-carboxylase] ligase
MPSDRLDLDRLLASSLVADVEYYATLGSTNDRAKECAARGPGKLPLLVIADAQTAGRGRGANRWWTGHGSLAFTLLFDAHELGLERMRLPLVALATGVAVVEAVAPLVPSLSVGVRWPNDVYVGDRKLAGLLVEVPTERFFVVGIGVNINNTLADAPAELARKVTTLRDLTGAAHDRTAILLAILAQLTAWLRCLASTPEAVGSRANQLCLQHGQTLTLDAGGRLVTGTCAGVASDGALLLETPEGRRRFYSGVLKHDR